MKRRCTIAGLLIMLFSPLAANTVGYALGQPDVIISELQTANATASEEFIELYNMTDHDIDFGDTANQGKDVWKLQFFSSTKVTSSGINWDPNTPGLINLSLMHSNGSAVIISAHSYFLISTSNTSPYRPGGIDPDFTYGTAHMSDAGGGVQLVDVLANGTSSQITAHDHLGWFKPTTTLTVPPSIYPTPSPGASLQRTIEQESYTSSSESLLPFVSTTTVSPKEAWVIPSEVIDSIGVDGAESSDDTEISENDVPSGNTTEEPVIPEQLIQLQPIEITELLPNPGAPQNDANDEYIELFNPNSQAVDLTGYTMQTGLKFNSSYTIINQMINPEAYLTLSSANTKLVLANSGGQARLQNKSGDIISQTAVYDTAASGQAWALVDDIWHWTTTPTPAAANILTDHVSSTSKATISQTTRPVPAKTPKAPAKATVAKASKSPKAGAKSAKSQTTTAQQIAADEANRPAPLHKAVLVGVGAIAVLYGAYEYRADMGNKIFQFRRYRETRRTLREAAEGAGSD